LFQDGLAVTMSLSGRAGVFLRGQAKNELKKKLLQSRAVPRHVYRIIDLPLLELRSGDTVGRPAFPVTAIRDSCRYLYETQTT